MSERRSRRTRDAVTLHDVAAVAGVSPMTVSRVVGGIAVNEAMRQRVAEAIATTGYKPNASAQRLASGGQLRIGVLHGNPSPSFTSALLVGLIEGGSRYGVQILFERCLAPGDARACASRLMRAGAAGVILPTPFCELGDIAVQFAEHGVVSLALGSSQAHGHPLALVIDNVTAARKMTERLIEMGHREIGFIRGHPAQLDSAQRFAGFAEALAAAGLDVRPELVCQGDYSYRSGVRCGEVLLEEAIPPTAIFASNDDMAAGALVAAHRRGLDVPGTLSVVGFDDAPLASTVWPSLTTIRQPIEEMGARAVGMLIARLRARPTLRPRQTKLETALLELVERESASPPAAQ